MLCDRLFHELRNLWRTLPPGVFALYIVCLIKELPNCVRSRKLAPVDKYISGLISVVSKGCSITVPLAEMDAELTPIGDTVTFAGVREMIANDIYLRAFTITGACDTVVDLGSNRGLFLALSLRVLKSRLTVGVEPSRKYEAAWKSLVNANKDSGQDVHRIASMVAESNGAGQVSMNEIVSRYEISGIDFLKCDIEGGEYSLFSGNTDWLRLVRNLALEIHQNGDKQALREFLQLNGFATKAMNQSGAECSSERWEYIYASKTDFAVGSTSSRSVMA